MTSRLRCPHLLLILGGLSLSSASCTRLARPYAPPTAEAVLAALNARARAIRTLRAEGKALYRGKPRRVAVTVRLMAARPAKLRFDLVSPFESPLATLVTRGGKFTLIDTQRNQHYHGPASPCNLARLMRVALPPEHILSLMTGGTPLIGHSRRRLRWDARTGTEELHLEGDRLSQLIRLDGRHRRWDLISSEVRDERGRVLFRVSSSAYRSIGGHALPEQVLLEQPRENTAIALKFKAEAINIVLPQAAFEPPSANGLPSHYVSCP